MGYKKSATKLCYFLRHEAGLCWQPLVELHRLHRDEDYWLSSNYLESLTKGSFAQNEQTVQALAQKLAGNIETTSQNIREQKSTGHKVTPPTKLSSGKKAPFRLCLPLPLPATLANPSLG